MIRFQYVGLFIIDCSLLVYIMSCVSPFLFTARKVLALLVSPNSLNVRFVSIFAVKIFPRKAPFSALGCSV